MSSFPVPAPVLPAPPAPRPAPPSGPFTRCRLKFVQQLNVEDMATGDDIVTELEKANKKQRFISE